ncbi:hypothetical protein F5144DRAFT_633628 [Chaetomium tenue]|uniref:Uncharacterized protein n=1 Tax=Chaetomium tenue TaxID=1854479 RepID=A0ACB7NYV1_9PEZI|nr:hypothetical protein F5144DRAFT_633628 [Chaetomium globosum]
MSGFEIFGAVSGVLGVIGVVKSCIDLLDIISTARSTERDLEGFFIHLQWQRIRFASWVVESGFGDILMQEHYQGAQPDLARPWDEAQALSHLPRQFRADIFLSLVKRTIENMVGNLKEADAIIRRYDGVTIASAETRFGDWGERIKQLKLHLGSKNAVVARPSTPPPGLGADNNTGTRKIGVRNTIRWVAADNKQLNALYEGVCRYNNDLAIALPASHAHSFERRVERGVTTSGPITSWIRDTAEGAGVALEAPASLDVAQLAPYRSVVTLQMALKSLELETAANNGPGIQSRNPIGAVLPAAPRSLIGLENVKIRLADVKPASPSAAATYLVQHREFVSFRSSPAVLEWRYYSTQSSRQTRSYLDSRVHMLTLQLQQLSALPSAGVLGCLGYVHDEKNSRHGLVYAYPEGLASTATPISLRERLHRDHADGTRRDQDARLACAHSLVLSVYRLLSVSWLHKNITAESVLLFENDAALRGDVPASEDDDGIHDGLPHPFLGAFSFSRRDAQLELSERLASAYHQQPQSAGHPGQSSGAQTRRVPPPSENEHMLYWHPDRSPPPAGTQERGELVQGADCIAQSYRREFDVYSLGVLLLEIGLWCPIGPISRKAGKKDAQSFATLLRTKYVQALRSKMGARYADIVRCCLQGDFGAAGRSEDPESLTEEDYLAGVRLFLEDFEAKVVSKVESMPRMT